MNNKDWIKKINELTELNPKLPIEFLVDGETICDPDEYSFTKQSIYSVEISVWYDDSESILTDASEIEDRIWDEVGSSPDLREPADKGEIERLAAQRWNKEVKEVILVKLTA